MLAAAVDSLERLLVKKHCKTVTLCHLAEDKHSQLVLVGSHIDCGINRCYLELVRSHFVMLCFCRYAHLPQFAVQLPHEVCNFKLDVAVIMAVEFLSLARHRTVECTLAEHKV